MNSHIPSYAAGRLELVWLTHRTWDNIAGLYNLLIFSSLLLCFECVAMAYISCIIQHVQWNMILALIPFLVAFSIYNLNRKTDEDEDAVNRTDRFAFTKRYERPLYYGAIVGFLLALALSALFGIPSLLATLAPFILGTLYSFRLLPKSFRYRRLKEIPGVKNIVVGLAWAILLAFLPIFSSGKIIEAGAVVTFLLFFMWGFMASLIPDIRDKEGDVGAGVQTIPVIFGVYRTKLILAGVILLIGIPTIVLSFFTQPSSVVVLVIAASLYSFSCMALIGRKGIIDFLADCISDGQYIFFAGVVGVFVLLGTIL